MPEFIDVASYFDDTDIYDGYTDALLYKGQFGTFDEAARDGTTSKRRTLSLRPGFEIPTRRLLSIIGNQWVVGDGTPDSFDNEIVRTTYWLKRVTDLAQVLTPAQACADAAGIDLGIHKVYIRDTLSASNADYDAFFNVFCNLAEIPAKASYIRTGSTYLRVRNSHRDINGMALAECDELDSPTRVAVTAANSGIYDPITDTYPGDTTTLQGLMFDRYKGYELQTQADPLTLAGDKTLILSTDKPIGQRLVISGVSWQVIAKHAELDGWSIHIRRQ
jgi:hypothetical protein